jgi:glycosyltransferase involved in cell wall biosynthesis
MVSECSNAALVALICTSPYWTILAEQWPGPVIYYSLDYTYAYDGFSPARILELDKRLCRKAVRVFPVSRRIGDYLVTRAGCAPGKITVLPNATLSQNVRAESDGCRAERPDELKDIDGPMAGVIGNMADNIDWNLLKDSVEMTPWLHWVFIGPYDTKVADCPQSKARNAVMSHPRTRFMGVRRYNELQAYARSLDVAVMPYRRKEPTYSGSAMRFYEHLAAGRPMIATRNVAELLEKEPLLKLVDSAAQLVKKLAQLRENDFNDGWGEARIRASRNETWDVRAQVMLSGIMQAQQETGLLQARQKV